MAVVERFKQHLMCGLSAKNIGRCGEVWSLVEVQLYFLGGLNLAEVVIYLFISVFFLWY